MTPVEAEALLKVLGSKKISRDRMPWLTGQCPLARWRHQNGTDTTPSFAIMTGKNRARCHCFSCNFSSDMNGLIGSIMIYGKGDHGYDLRVAEKIIEGDSGSLDLSTDDEQDFHRPPVVFPESFWQTFAPAINIDEARGYLNGRGVTNAEIESNDIRWDGLSRRVCIPVRGFDHFLYGVRGRALDPANPLRYLSYPLGGITNPTVWLGEDIVDFEQPILVVEASFQRIAARRLYKNTIAPLSAGIHKSQADRMGSGYCFVHCFDGDKAGREASKRLTEYLPEALHVRLDLPENTGPDDLPVYELEKILQQALPVG